jgi:uncharacterized Tic20 family protein
MLSRERGAFNMPRPTDSTEENQKPGRAIEAINDSLEFSALRPVSTDERNMALFAHLGGLLAGFIAPLIIWQLKKKSSRYVAHQAKEALNFQLFLLLSYLLCGFLVALQSCLGYLGAIPLLALVVYEVVVVVQAGIATGRGERYRYPFTIRFLS